MPQYITNLRVSRLTALFLAVAFGVLALSGCGGGSDGTSGAVALSKAEYIRRGDILCRKADVRQSHGLKAYELERPKNEELANRMLALVVGLPPLHEEAEELKELGPPATDASGARAVIKAIEEGLQVGKKDPARVLTEGKDNAFAHAEKVARQYGFKVCGEV